MQPFAQETIKIRKNRRKEKRSSKLPPSQLFLYVFGSSALSAPTGLTGILAGILAGLERFAPAKISLRLLRASRSREQDVVPKSLCQGCSQASSLWTPGRGQNRVTAYPIPSHFPNSSVPPNCLWSMHFLPLSGWENVFLAQTLDQPIQLHPNYLCGNRMLCQKCYSVYLSILPNRSHLYNQEIQYFLQHRKAAAQEPDWSCETLLFHRYWK